MKRILLLFGIISCWVSTSAQQNVALQAVAAHSGGGATTFGPQNYNDGIIPAGTAQPWGWVSSNGWVEYTWTNPVSIQDIVMYHGTRKVTDGIIEIWDGTTYVTVVSSLATYLQPGNEDTIKLPTRVTTTKLRFNNLAGSNPNWREIEVYKAPTGLHDAGVKSTSDVAAVCPGSYPVNVTIQNFGINQIDSVMVNWSVDGMLQTPVWHKGLLDTVGGAGLSEAVVILGNYTFTSGVTYQLKSWTSMPNSAVDTTNLNDTLSVPIRLGAPTGFSVSNVMTTSALLSWNALGASNFRVMYGAAGFNPQTGGSVVSASGSSTTISSLSANTLYDAYLIADCGAGIYSDTTGPVSFRTPCVIAVAPFSENFDGSSWVSGAGAQNSNASVDPCWSRTPDLATPSVFQMGPRSTSPSSGNGPVQDLTGGNYIYGEASYGGSGSLAELKSPPIDVSGLTTPGLYFFQHRFSNGGAIADMFIEVSNDFGTSWDTVYNITGETQNSMSDAWSLEFVNLVAYTGDTVIIKFVQKSNGCCGDAAIDSVVVDEAPTCPWPTGAGVVTTTDSSAVISWNDPTGSAWEVIWGPPGFTQASPGSGTRNTTNNPDTIPGLQSNTDYEYYVRTDCGLNGNSIWIGPISFTTECSPLVAPYFNNFDSEASGNPPSCWSDYRVGSSINFSQANVLATSLAYSPGNVLYLYNYTPITASDTTISVMPAFSDMPAGDKQLRFKAYSPTTSSPFIIVGTMSASGIGSSFTPLDTVLLTTSYQEYVVQLTAANGYNGTDLYPAFMHGKSATFQTIYIDDFNYEVIPPCAPPTSLSLGVSFVGSSNAELYWGVGAGDSTKVEVGVVGFNPGSGLQTVAAGTAGDTVLVSGLQPQTTYEFYINDTCYGVGGSGWIGPFEFTTSCLPIAAPYTETFDGTSWIIGNGSGSQTGTVDVCWTRSPDANATWTWNVYNASPSSVSTGPDADFTGTGNFLYTDASYSSGTGQADIYSPLIDVSSLNVPYVKFYYHRYGTASQMGDMEVAVNDGNGWVTLVTLSGTDQTSGADPWKEQGVDVSAFNDTIQVRFRGNYVACCSGDMAIDQFSVGEAPSCPNLLGLNIGSVIDTGATASWVASANANSYQVWLGPQGFYQGTSTIGGVKGISSTNSFVFDTLSPNTCYEYLVRAACGPGDSSAWAGPFTFCTPCSPVAAPYFENFDALSTALVGDLGNCWVGSGSTSTYSWRTNTGTTTSGSTGPNGDATTGTGIYLYTESSSGTTGDEATMTSPLIDVSSLSSTEMRFSYHMYGATVDTLYVDIYDGVQWNNAVWYIEGQQQTSSADPWKDTLIDLTSYATNGLIQARFRAIRGTSFTGDISIDDVEFSAPITCPSPSNLTVSSVSGSNATISWSSIGAAQSYIVEYGQGGFTPGTGTVATVTGTSYSISGLPQNNVAYQAYVRAYCGGTDSSFWTGPVTIITDPNLCTEDFEVYNVGLIDGQSTLFLGWNGDGLDAEVNTAQSSSGSKSLHIHTSGPNASSDVVADLGTSFTSGIHSLKFNMFVPSTYGGYYNILHDYTGPTNVWAIEVYIDANGTASVEMGTNATGTIGTFSTTPNSWNTIEHIIDLDNDTAWIMVNGVNTNLGWQFSLGSTNMGDRFNAVNFYSAANAGQTPKYYVDDFCVQPYVPVACPAPTTLNVSNTNIGCDSAEVSWVSQSVGNSTLLEYGPTGFTPGTGTLMSFVSSPYVIAGLTPSTGYDFYVSDTCGSSDTSALAGPFSFSTTAGSMPLASFTYSSTYTATSQDVTFDASASLNADTLKWDFGNGSTATGATANTSYPLPNTSYSVTLTAITRCGLTDDTTIVINTNIGLEDLGFSGTFKLYPNPNSGVFKVQLSLDEAIDSRLVITDASGKELLSEEIQSEDGYFERTIDVKYLPKGVYFLKLETKNGKVLRRFVKE